MTLDQKKDVAGTGLYRIALLYDMPAYVKAADDAHLKCNYAAPPQAYADQVNRLFPIHTAAATWLSSAYFATVKTARADSDIIRANLRAAGAYWGIIGDLDRLDVAVKVAELRDDSELPDDVFAVVEVFDDGHRERHIRLSNANEIKVAAAWLHTYRDDFPYADRRTIARKIVKRANDLAVDIDTESADHLDRMGGFGAGVLTETASMLDGRAAMARERHPALAEKLAAAASAIHGGATLTSESRFQLTAAVDAYDRITGLVSRYDDLGVQRPEDVIYSVTEKVARDFSTRHIATPTGAVYEAARLGRVAASDVTAHMGSSFADAITDGLWIDEGKAAAMLPTMPRDDAAAFDRMARSLGFSPALKVAGSREIADLASLAAAMG